MTDADRADSRDLRFRQARHARIAQHNRQGITEVQRCTLTSVQRNPGVSCDACGRFPGRMRVIREIVSIPQLRVCEASVLQNRQRASRGFENFSVQPGNQHSGLSARLALTA